MEAMKIDVSEAEVDLIVGALEHYFAYARSTNRDGSRYQDLAERLKGNPTAGASQSKASPKKKQR
jgi:hypothetical protein